MRYFVTSDIHSFYTPLKKALKTAKFDTNNPEHVLVICGDVFDRGEETMEVFNFLKSIPEDRLILIRGNHEDLFEELLKSDFPHSHDFSNGTVRTFCAIAGIDEEQLTVGYWLTRVDDFEEAYEMRYNVWTRIVEEVKKSEVYQWLCSDKWVNYFELGNHILVHSFIPLNIAEDNRGIIFGKHTKAAYQTYCSYMDNWRNATDEDWYFARWGCPYLLFNAELFNPEIANNKVLVCGHWHTSDFHDFYEPNSSGENFDIYYGKNLIALDACTAYSGKTNVLIIEDGICYNKYRKKLVSK